MAWAAALLSLLKEFLELADKTGQFVQNFGFWKATSLFALCCFGWVVFSVLHLDTDQAIHHGQKEIHPKLRQRDTIVSLLGGTVIACLVVLFFSLEANPIRQNDVNEAKREATKGFSSDPGMSTCPGDYCGTGGLDVDPSVSYNNLRPADIVQATKTEALSKRSFVCTVSSSKDRSSAAQFTIAILMRAGGACQRYFNAKTEAVQLQVLASPSHGRLDTDDRHFLYVPDEHYVGADRFVLSKCAIGSDLSRPKCENLVYTATISD